MRAIVKILYFFLLLSIEMLGQDYSIRGVIRDSIDNNPCLGANIKLFSVSLSPKTIFTTSDTKGYFQFVNIKPGSYILEISFIGFERFVDTIHIAANSINLGNILMRRSSVQLEQVEVLGNIIQAEQKEDTIQFLAKGFKVNKDATAEELITKIPGVIKEDGKIKTQGEDVKQILVDGKPFFGDDPDIVLKNLPAEVIEKIQVYDRMSDQAQFTGFDDGQASKTINIITRQDRQHGQFGKLYAGYGTDDKYLSGGNVNLFNQQRRISLIGLVNNINQQNFSAQDLLGISGNRGDRQFRPPGGGGRGFSGRGGGGETENFLVGGQEGNTNTYSFGFNFIDNLWNDLSINGSYFLNHTNNINDQSLTREYYSDPDNPQLYSENSAASSKNFNHRINMRAEYSIDSLN
ncbi:MAG: carboxypeptidase-like regulatory domain-containing protein [Ignavibacteriaceae bacterium]|nr:carboxypeptidase-like regulatory domain-containing protein [Ignavibacteriaceae bacterium]